MSKKLIYLISFVLVLGLFPMSVAKSDDPDLVGYWRFDEGSGTTAFDSSGNGNDGIFVGDPKWVPGKLGGALEFDGDDYLNCGNGPTLEIRDQITIAFWFKVDAFQNTWEAFFSKGDGAYRVSRGGGNGNGTHMGISGTSASPSYFNGPTIITGGDWHHFAGTYDGTEGRIYIDGVLDVTYPSTGQINIESDPLWIGNNSQNTSRQLHGLMDDVRLYSRALRDVEILGIMAGGGAEYPTASGPNPENGVMLEDTWVNLGWRAGDFALSHDVYFGDNFDDVNAGAESVFQGNQATTSLIAGFPGFPYPDGLVPGTTYYWRIDEVNDTEPNSPWKGEVWSFWIPPKKAYEPNPAVGAKFVDPDVELNWTAGFRAKLHYVHFGDNFDDVNNATIGIPSALNTFTPPGTLELEKTYYWRVDEFDAVTTHKGDVWSFRTLPEVPITNPNLIGWWKLDESPGTTAFDWSGHGNHGTIVDNVQWVPGQFNLALEFLGDDQGHVELPPGMVNTANGSVLMWVNTDLTDDEGMFWYGTETGGDGFGGENEIHIHIDDPGVLGFGLEGATDVRLDGPQLAGAGWTHVAATWDLTDGCRLYANGVEVDFQAHNSTVADLAVIRLGRPVGTGNGNRYHDGLMDDVRLFDHAISAAQVVEVMRGDPLLAWGANPANGSTLYIRDATPLSWSPGDNASQHDIYFGTDRGAVADADASDTTGIYRGRQGVTIYTPPDVEWGGGPYYWRVDEYNTDATISKGNVWSFTVTDFLGIDDFEDYNDYEPDRIYETWIDGWGTTTNGSTVGYPDPNFDQGEHFVETDIVHGGSQSMPLFYDNNFKYSEATLTLVSARDWTEEGVGVLSLWFYGDASNAAELMYVALNGSAVVYHDNPNAALIEEWTEWTIDLQEFAAQGVNLANVNTIAIGFGDKNNLQAGGSGMVFFDDIRLYRPAEPEPEPQP